jgi:UDP-N-acetylmuramate dehydrogenase
MQITPQVKLANYSTMRLGGLADFSVEVTSRNDLSEALAWAESKQLPVIMIGGGSNIVWRDEGFQGLLIINKILGYEDYAEDDLNHYITIGAGEDWDAIVARTVTEGLSGIEALSLIPGTAGATPIQNVGAYGQEIADTLTSLEAYDTLTHNFLTIPASDGGFGYRSSRFNGIDKNRFYITAVTLHLLHQNPSPPFYKAVEEYFTAEGTTDITPQILRDTVINIRRQKLPDWHTIANNGSFFANPIISYDAFVQLHAQHENIPHWSTDNGIKIPAAWLLEHAGFQDFHDPETGMGTWPSQPLVLINEHASSTAQLLMFRNRLISAVYEKFGITLIQEPELLPNY